MSTTKSDVDAAIAEPSLAKTVSIFLWILGYLGSLIIVALGQPDRFIAWPLLSYSGGFLTLFLCLFTLSQRWIRLVVGFFWMLGVQLYQLDWLATTTYHGKGILIVYLLLSAGIACQFALLTLFFPPSHRSFSWIRVGAIASFWTLFEISRLYYLCGFPFNPVGLVMSCDPHLMQSASLLGIYGCTFWVIWVAAVGAKGWRAYSPPVIFCWGILLFLPVVFGKWQINRHEKGMQHGGRLQVALVQTGLEVEQKWSFPDQEETYVEPFEQWRQIFSHLTSLERDSWDLIVLPEVALPGDAHEPKLLYSEAVAQIIQRNDRLPPLAFPYAARGEKGEWWVSHAWMAQAMANLFKSEVVVGLLDYDEKKQESYNSAFHFVPFRTGIHRYEKRVLVPLAEYLPLPMMKSFLEKYGITSFFTPGRQAKVFTGRVPLSVSICYEEGFSHLMREGRLLGAKLFVNVTNDGWFPKSRLPKEHFHLGRLRSVENGVPIVRACNTGITAAVDSLGRVQGVLNDVDANGITLQGVVACGLPLYTYSTLYAKFGDHLIVLLSVLILLTFTLYRKVLQL